MLRRLNGNGRQADLSRQGDVHTVGHGPNSTVANLSGGYPGGAKTWAAASGGTSRAQSGVSLAGHGLGAGGSRGGTTLRGAIRRGNTRRSSAPG